MTKPYPKSKVMKPISMEDLEESKVWITKTCEAIHITDLRKTHISNILDILEKKPTWRQEYKPVLIAELRRRKELSLIKKGKAGKLLYGKKL